LCDEHLYFRLEESQLDLHSARDGCFEIRNFMNDPGSRNNKKPNLREGICGVRKAFYVVFSPSGVQCLALDP